MKKTFEDLRHRLEYLLALFPYLLLRLSPYWMVKVLARFFSVILTSLPMMKEIVYANIKAAMPELSNAEVKRIGKRSIYHMLFNLLEFFWLNGKEERIKRCYFLNEEITASLKQHVANQERIIFVNPHLGSWEASGVMAPFYAGVKMAAIAKPMSNPYLNKLLNHGNREKVPGLEIIFSKGAVRAAIAALKAGKGVGTLIDQNTRVRDGGEFVNFFGIPVPSSTAPANLLHYCRAHQIPAVIIYGTSVRMPDGRISACMEYLSKPVEEYASEVEILQDLMTISEQYIRRYPDQYLWLYKRFRYIPPTASDEERKRYPGYARPVSAHFFSRKATME